MAEKNKGKITQVISAVLDIKFPDGKLPRSEEHTSELQSLQ